MTSFSSAIFYILTFLAVYVQVFFLITFFENHKKIIKRRGGISLSSYPTVTIIVPCWNEEKTLRKTIQSIFSLSYPKDKLKIILIDDGSTDKTWNIMSQFEDIDNVKVMQKENGGKYTAINLGLQNTETEFVGCLDADSFVHPEALKRIMSYFESDLSTMAVAPSIIVNTPMSIIQRAQKAEYDMAVYIKKMLGFLGAIHVTPGPFTIFRKKVFDDLGPYRHAHNTEDMEIAFRMQKNNYKIEQSNDAYVYTNAPKTVGKLFRQRLRWIYGFLNNTIDYRYLIFKKQYGNFSLFTIPAGIISVLAALYLFSRLSYNLVHFIYIKLNQISVVGVHNLPSSSHIDFFYMNTGTLLFITLFLYSLVILSMILGQKMAEGKIILSRDMLYFFVIFSVVAPFWIIKAIYNTVISKRPAWR
jgi:cellulose synthase/poly-beta-1,6-N-acetylglucosamine synthase-like glycosyltransferase